METNACLALANYNYPIVEKSLSKYLNKERITLSITNSLPVYITLLIWLCEKYKTERVID